MIKVGGKSRRTIWKYHMRSQSTEWYSAHVPNQLMPLAHLAMIEQRNSMQGTLCIGQKNSLWNKTKKMTQNVWIHRHTLFGRVNVREHSLDDLHRSGVPNLRSDYLERKRKAIGGLTAFTSFTTESSWWWSHHECWYCFRRLIWEVTPWSSFYTQMSACYFRLQRSPWSKKKLFSFEDWRTLGDHFA